MKGTPAIALAHLAHFAKRLVKGLRIHKKSPVNSTTKNNHTANTRGWLSMCQQKPEYVSAGQSRSDRNFMWPVVSIIGLMLCVGVHITAEAAWSDVSVGTVVTDTTPGTITITAAPNVAEGRTLIISLSYDASDNAVGANPWTTPSGWTLVASNDGTTSTQDGNAVVYCKTAGAGEGSVAITGANNGFTAQGVMLSYAGGTCTVHVTAVIDQTSAVADVATPARTISEANTLVLFSAGLSFSGADAGVTSWPASATTRLNAATSSGSVMGLLVGDLIQTTATNISAGSIDLVTGNTFRAIGTIVSLSAANAVFTVNPTVTDRAADYTVGGTTGGSVEVDCVAVPKDATAPTVAEVDAGTASGGGAALDHTSETWNGADSMVLDMAAVPPLISDIYCTDGTNLVTLIDEKITPTGYQAPVALTSICTESTCPIKVHNDAETTDVATGDYVSWHSVTTPSSFAITMALDGNITYTDPTESAQWANLIAYDVSAGANFTTLDPERFDFNADPIECDPVGYVGPAVKISTDPGNVALASFVNEPNGYAVTYAELSGDFGGRTVNTSSGVLSGTIQADEQEAGITAVMRATSASGSTCDVTVRQYPIDTLTVPNGSGVLCTTFAATIEGWLGEFAWLTASSTYATSQTVAVNYVASQDPAALTEVEPNTAVSFVCSLGPPGGGVFGWPVFDFKFGK